jgi:hypothetical protein
MSIPNQTFLDGLHDAQLEVLQAFDDSEARFFDLEWHRKARKTTLLLNLLIRECCRKPKGVYCYVGPNLKQARETVWDDPNMLDAYLPDPREMAWKKNESKLHVKFANGSLLKILGAAELGRMRGPDCEGVGIDEWSVHENGDVWHAVFEPVIRLKPHRWAMFLWTPVNQHAIDAQAERKKNPQWYVRTLTADMSGVIPKDVLADTKANMPRAFFDREYMCSHVSDEEMSLITSKTLAELNEYQTIVSRPFKRIISIDPALGGDACTMRYFENFETKARMDVRSNDPKVVYSQALIFGEQNQCSQFIIDSIGLGLGIGRDLQEAGKVVILFNSSEQAEDPKRFGNKKAELWWYCMEQICAHRIPPITEGELLRQIPVAARYRVVSGGGKILMRLKEESRKILGRSPDDADSWAYGIWGLQFVEPDIRPVPDDFDPHERRRSRSFMGA